MRFADSEYQSRRRSRARDREGGGEAIFVRADVSNRADVEKMVQATLDRFGKIDILVNNAGIHDGAHFTEESEEMWQRLFRVNAMGTVLPSQGERRLSGPYLHRYAPGSDGCGSEKVLRQQPSCDGWGNQRISPPRSSISLPRSPIGALARRSLLMAGCLS
jgi:NAD(P)-dependent dehydrogenase (short-subunit alcohol dehydrogenase family)